VKIHLFCDGVFTLHLHRICARAQTAFAGTREPRLPDYERVLGPDHPNTLRKRWFLARCHLDLGDAARAKADHKGVVAGLRASGKTDQHRYLRDALALEAELAAM